MKSALAVGVLALILPFALGCGRATSLQKEKPTVGPPTVSPTIAATTEVEAAPAEPVELGSTDDAPPMDALASDDPRTADVVVSAIDLYTAYKTDPHAADLKYKGKRLAVTGSVGARDDNPKNVPDAILFGLKGSSQKDEFVACYFSWESERFFHRLDAKPKPPILGTCAGAAESEYGKKGSRPMEVRLLDCTIAPPATVTTPYDRGFADGQAIGKDHLGLFRRARPEAQNAVLESIENTLDIYEEIAQAKAANVRRGGVPPSDADESRGRFEGYFQAVSPTGVQPLGPP
ncbi:MAG TPA: hypothetical protein VGE52_22375 [Pirellulales bacterium]